VDHQSNDAANIKVRSVLIAIAASPHLMQKQLPAGATKALRLKLLPAIGRAPDGRTWILGITLDVRAAWRIGKDGRRRACKHQQNQNGFFSCHGRISYSAPECARFNSFAHHRAGIPCVGIRLTQRFSGLFPIEKMHRR
jgi:hypothetical protein